MELALKISSSPVYIATARHWDDDFKNRIRRHQNERDDRWTTIEEEKYIGDLLLHGKVAVVDCVTLWLANFFTDTNHRVEESLSQAMAEFDKIKDIDGTFIFVSNEIGMGVHAETETGRKFVELQGWMNQYIAKHANEVILMVSGIPVKIKTSE